MAECMGCGHWVETAGSHCGDCTDAHTIAELRQRVKELEEVIVEAFDIICRDYPDVMTTSTRINNWKMGAKAALEGGEQDE